MSLHQEIKSQMVGALKARQTLRLNVLRGLLTAFTNKAVAERRKPDEALDDEEALTVIARAVKQRKDSIEQFEKGGRLDLAEVEKKELIILEKYLPTQMSREEVFEYVKQKLTVLSSSSDKPGAGQFMGMIMKELKGKADGAVVKEAVNTKLA